MPIDLESVKKIPIETVIARFVKLKKRGADYVAPCPFHNERTASFHVSPAKGIYKCFGCGRSGDAVNFIQETKNIDFKQALKYLSEEFNIKSNELPNVVQEKKEYVAPLVRPQPLSVSCIQFLEVQRCLSTSTIKSFGITQSKEYLAAASKKIDVFCFNYYRDGELINIKFRGLEKIFQLCPGAELIPYNLDSIAGPGPVLIAEGEIDCMSWHEAGVTRVVSAPNGASANVDWVGSHFAGKDPIYIASDNDEAGRKMQAALIKRFSASNIILVNFPDDRKDANEVLVKDGAASLKALYDSSVVVYNEDLPDLVEDSSNPDESLTVMRTVRGGTIYEVNVPGVLYWATQTGYRWIKYSDGDNSPVMLVRIIEGIIYPVTEQDVVHEFLKEVDFNYSEDNNERLSLYRFTGPLQNLIVGLPFCSEIILRDTRDICYIFFNNGILEVKATSERLVPYGEMDGLVWSRYILPHNYTKSHDEGDFKKFLEMISIDPEHYKSICSTLGYLLHSYKLRTQAKAVVIVEDIEDETEARGRSGKGLIAQFIELFKNTVQIDGRNYKGDDKFKMQAINLSTQILYVNDPPQNLLLSQFYNMITDDFMIEVKGKSSYMIPFKRSPKIMVTTNYLPVLHSDSDKDRFIVMPIKKVFGSDNTISKAFPGVLFFDADTWPVGQFEAVFGLGVHCLQSYLAGGILAYSSPSLVANAAKRIIQSSVPDYISETMDQVLMLWSNCKSIENFNNCLIDIDLRLGEKESLKKVFEWLPDQLTIMSTAFYRYALVAYRAKTNDRWFGRKLRLYLEHSDGLLFEENRNNTMGKKVTVYRKSPF